MTARISRFWYKRTHSRSTKRKNIFKGKVDSRLVRTVLVIVFSLVFFSPIIFVVYPNIKGFYSIKFSREIGDRSEREEVWKGERRINVLLIGLDRKNEDIAFVDSLSVLALDPEKKTLGIFVVDPDIEVYIASENKQSSLKKLYNWGRLREEPVCLDLMVDAVESLLSVRIDRYLSIDKEDFQTLLAVYGKVEVEVVEELRDEDIRNEKGIFEIEKGKHRVDEEDFMSIVMADTQGRDTKHAHQFSAIKGLVLSLDEIDKLYEVKNASEEISRSVRSNFEPGEFRRLIWLLREVSFDRVKAGYTKETSSYMSEGGRKIPMIERIDEDVTKIFFNVEVQREQARIELLNGTAVPGIGTKKARWISNVGAKVINVGNSRDHYSETIVYTKEPVKYIETIKELENIFGTKIVLIENVFPYRHTGDIVVVIGDNGIN